MSYDPRWAAAGKSRNYVLTGLGLNSAGSDAGSFADLPAKYLVTGFRLFDASTTPTLATVGLRTASGGGGNEVVTAVTITGMSTASAALAMAIALTGYQTATSLYVRNGIANGSALTVSAILSILDLT